MFSECWKKAKIRTRQVSDGWFITNGMTPNTAKLENRIQKLARHKARLIGNREAFAMMLEDLDRLRDLVAARVCELDTDFLPDVERDLADRNSELEILLDPYTLQRAGAV